MNIKMTDDRHNHNLEDSELNLDYDVESDIAEESSSLEIDHLSELIMYSRDWTIGTIYDQIVNKGNIQLDPEFQRRNVWKDDRKSRLIESILIGYPIPEIVLAQDLENKGKFIVIDGKQRLLTVVGFKNNKLEYWKNNKLSSLKVRKDLNGKDFDSLSQSDKDVFENMSLRCTVISNYGDSQVLYDIFYRLNTGTAPLATQELRQVLNKGKFANYLIQYTNDDNAIRKVMGLKGPDNRLRDVEVLLRLILFMEFASEYNGDLKKFLDNKMRYATNNWDEIKEKVKDSVSNIEKAIAYLREMFPNYVSIATRETNGRRRFNRVLLEVQVFFFSQLNEDIQAEKITLFQKEYNQLLKDERFIRTLDTTTKSIENYNMRYSLFEELMKKVFNKCSFYNPFRLQ